MKQLFAIVLLFLLSYSIKAQITTTAPGGSSNSYTSGNLGIGIGTATPQGKLHIGVASGNTTALKISGDNSDLIFYGAAIALSSRPTWTYVPYIEWNAPNGLRQGYLGWQKDYLNLTLENGYNFSINGGKVVVGSYDTRGDHLHVNTGSGGQFFRANSYGAGVADAGWTHTLYMSNYSNYSEIYNNGGKPLILQHQYPGNVGISNTSPQAKLHITSVEKTAFRINNPSSTNNYLSIWHGTGGAVLDPIGTGLLYLGYDNPTTIVLNRATTGNVLIGKETQANSRFRLDVAGPMRANEIVVNTTGADFVFEDNYSLKPLEEVEQYIKENKHLPEIASASEMQSEGMSVGELQTKLLQKIEELTLYVIEVKKENTAQTLEIEILKKQNQQLIKKTKTKQ